jgi:hypothetical protein|tara:strand:- start:37093 stop:37482 length:390 start_codon:yes stop_codon:yes gene_type:complete
MNKEAYTKIFLKEKGMAMSEANIKQYMPLWWRNIRNKEKGGLRLTEDGFDLLSEIGIELYDIPYPKDMPLTTQVIIFLDQFIDCPYYFTNRSIFVTSEKKAVELTLFSGDLRKYGITKAMNRDEKNANE